MKNELKISTISMICVLCASGMSGAYGASSVRTLGGTGTYTSAASASQSGGGTGVARAGSVRVTPTSAKATTVKPTGSASTSAGRVATSPRLSLGKYLGGGTAISGGSSVHPGTGTSGGGTTPSDPTLSAELNNRVNVLEDKVDKLKSVSEDLKESMQNKLTGDDYIEIDKDGNVSLIVDNLKEDLTGIDGREVLIGISNDKKYIQWQYDGDSANNWTKLIAVEDLVGPQGEKGEKGEKGDPGDGADLTLYSTTAEMNDAISKALGKVDDTYTKDEIDNAFVPSTSFEERMEELTTTVTENMQELQQEMTIVNQTVNNIITEEGNLVIEENSITNTEIAPGTITSTEIAEDAITNYELAPDAVELTHLSSEVTEQLVGAPEDEPNGMYVLLVTPSGERVWADLATADEE